MTAPGDRSPAPRVAYLTNQYPSVSHTFIRREIRALEERGYAIARAAIRPGGAVVDPADQEEAARTHYVLSAPKAALAARALAALVKRPGAAWRAGRMTWAMHRRSERGLFRHLAYLAEAACLIGWMRAREVAHVHVHFGTNAAAVARLLHALGGPGYSFTVHGPDEFDAPIGLSLGDKQMDARFTVAITHFCASQLRRWVPYAAWAKIHLVHCTVDPAWLDAARPIADDATDLVCVGRLAPQKGQLLLLDAFARAVAAGLPGRLVLVGDGELRGVIEERVAALGLEGRVLITGWLDEAGVRGRLLDARALVLGSFAEGLPVVIMEALALERPAIATHINGIPELVRPGENGWLAVAGDVEGLAGAIAECLRAPVEQLRAMGRAGARNVRENHLASTEAARLDALFRQYAPGAMKLEKPL